MLVPIICITMIVAGAVMNNNQSESAAGSVGFIFGIAFGAWMLVKALQWLPFGHAPTKRSARM
jgi:hypothetical protein